MTEGRYKCTLSPELLEKAVNELNEPRSNDDRLSAIDELRNSYNAEKYGPLYREDDGFLLRFLRAKKFNQKKALNVLHNYHSIRRDYKEVFEKVSNPAIMRPIAEKGIMFMLEGQDNNGAAVMFSRSGLIDENSDINGLMAYGVFLMEKVLEKERFQICGVTSIRDLKNFSLLIYTKISPIAIKRMTSVWQDAMPIRFKAAHILNEGTVYDVIITMFRPFIKKKFWDRMHIHGGNYKALESFIDPAVLPPYLGGTGPTVEHSAKVWLEKVLDDFPQDTAL